MGRKRRRQRRAWGWITAGLVALLGLEASPAQAAAAADADATSSRPPLVIVRGLGPVPTRSLQRACEVVLERYPVRCEIRGSRTVFEAIDAWSSDREQLDARRALQALRPLRGSDAGVEVSLTTADLYEAGKPYVFGLASLVDRLAIVSLARLGGEPDMREARLGTLVLHEVGHALGLPHHDDPGCVMRQDATVERLDTAPDGPCTTCRDELHATAEKLGRPGGVELDRIRAHLARGDDHMARVELVGALWAGATADSQLLHDVAIAFMEAGRFNEPISVLRFVVGMQPDFASAHVTLAAAYEARGRDGDLDLAVEHYDRARTLQPQWDLLDAHVHVLRGIAAQGPIAE